MTEYTEESIRIKTLKNCACGGTERKSEGEGP